MTPFTASVRPVLLAASLGLMLSSAWAGRPLVVDDASVNDKGKGHVEFWRTHADGVRLTTWAPAFAPLDGLELGGLLSRESQTRLKVSAVQLKWRITPGQDSGCNVAAVLGTSRAALLGTHVSAPYVTGLGTCNVGPLGSLHANLGWAKPKDNNSTRSWGVAYERGFGSVTPHIEWVGSQGVKPTVNLGLRGLIIDNLQLDGSVGRSDGESIYTLGVKFMF